MTAAMPIMLVTEASRVSTAISIYARSVRDRGRLER
jgi:hypothetical protein